MTSAWKPHSPILVGMPHASESFQAKPGAIGETNSPGARGGQKRRSAVVFIPSERTGTLPGTGTTSRREGRTGMEHGGASLHSQHWAKTGDC